MTAVGMAMGALAVVVAVRHGDWPAAALGLGAAAHLAALSSTSTPPTAYYLGPSFAGLTLALTLVCCRSGRRTLVLPVILVAASAAVVVQHGDLWSRGFAPIRQNWATNAEYEAIARDLTTGTPILSTAEIGALAFYCHQRCRVIDHVLADPGRVDGYVARWSRFHPTLAALNYHFYQTPAPIPVSYELRFGFAERRPTPSWPITRQPGFDQWAALAPTDDPLALLNR